MFFYQVFFYIGRRVERLSVTRTMMIDTQKLLGEILVFFQRVRGLFSFIVSQSVWCAVWRIVVRHYTLIKMHMRRLYNAYREIKKTRRGKQVGAIHLYIAHAYQQCVDTID